MSDDWTKEERARVINALERIADSMAATASDRRSKRVAAKRGHATQLKRIAKQVPTVYRPTELDKKRAERVLARFGR